jgi:hypothetical protein
MYLGHPGAWLRRNARGEDNGNWSLLLQWRDPAALGRWYKQHFEISLVPSSYEEAVGKKGSGPNRFCSLPKATDHFGDHFKPFPEALFNTDQAGEPNERALLRPTQCNIMDLH